MQLNEAIKIRLENLMKEKNISSKYEISCGAGLCVKVCKTAPSKYTTYNQC